MPDCKYCQGEICVNADCPMCADYCPVVDVLRVHLDRELADILKGRQDLIPFEERYPEIKEIAYKK